MFHVQDIEDADFVALTFNDDIAKRKNFHFYDAAQDMEDPEAEDEWRLRPKSSAPHTLRLGRYKRDRNGDVYQILWMMDDPDIVPGPV